MPLLVFNPGVGVPDTRWFDGEHWDRSAIELTLDQCEPDVPSLRRRLASPVPDADVDRFESRFSVSLPVEYRRFLTEVSAGGPGPGSGLFLFDRSDVDDAFSTSWATFAIDSDYYRTPFEPTPLDPAHLEGDPAAGDRHVAGTWLLADNGCADYTCLVLSGTRAGQLWDVDGVELSPIRPRFGQWYTTWLDRYLSAQTDLTQIRTGWSRFVTTSTWASRLIYNAIRDRDPTHRFVMTLDARNGLFDIERIDELPTGERQRFLEILEQVADDIADLTDPHHPRTTTPRAIVLETATELRSG